VIEKQLDNSLMASIGGLRERRPAILISSVNIDFSSVEKQLSGV
jgi:hypothetical protein